MRNVRVAGAGPAGLMAAEVLATSGFRVTILDHHRSPARKFLLAGRGGLNLTHSEPLEQMLSRYGDDRALLEAAIRDFPPDAICAWCAGLGVQTFVGSSGRVFPVGLKASPLLRAWLQRLGQMGVTLQSQTDWQGFDDTPTILALGGASWPELGSDAAWVSMFHAAGIEVTPLVASNVRLPIYWSAHFAERFSGQPIKNVAASAGAKRARGEIMIARDGIEGGAVYAVSRGIRDGGDGRLLIDLKPDLSTETVALRLAQGRKGESRSNLLRKALNLSPVAIGLMREACADNPKAVMLQVSGTPELRRAISTAGGVAGKELNADFSLKRFPYTFVVGEMLDWDAPTGGYLLQACLSSARFAAHKMVAKLRQAAV